MANTVVVGMQWGDEGKGKVVDLICPAFDAVVRYQGGHNAGHTVKFADRHFALHLIPSGIVHEAMGCVLGNGMVVAPEAFFAELDTLHELGVHANGRLFVSTRAQALLSHHAELDRRREESLGAQRLGTTVRGIGPAYELKAARVGLRLGDLLSPALGERLALQASRLAPEMAALGAGGPEAWLPAVEALAACGERLRPYLTDTAALLGRWLAEGKSLLFEGAQATLLDVDHGSYPYVTSSTATAGGAPVGAGVPPTCLDGIIGVLKAYTTRVGEGPFPSELSDDTGEYLRRRGNEVGTTTGRPRRCGWLDLVAARYARRLNGVDTVALTKLDVLDGFEELRLCTAYRIGGEEVREFPADATALASAEPLYEAMPGWSETTSGMLAWEGLPERARAYVARIEQEIDAPVSLISTGPRREETIVRNEPRLIELTEGRLDVA
ncbi:MAG: adenylosuccinate synthase [Thermoanaerobaculia bacterium]